MNQIIKFLVYTSFIFLALGPIVPAQSALGQIGSNIAGSFAVLAYAIYIVPVVVIIVLALLFWQRKRKSTKGVNLAMIYSLEHSAVSDIKPFVIVRKVDEVKNVESTIAIFPNDLKKESTGGVLGFFKGIFGAKPAKDLSEEEGVPFSEALALLNQKTGTWFAVFSLSTNMQLPVLSGISTEDRIYKELDRHVEKRVSQMKKSQLEGIGAINPLSPLTNFGKLQILCCVILFIAIAFLAFSILNVGSAITTINKTLTLLHLGANLTK